MAETPQLLFEQARDRHEAGDIAGAIAAYRRCLTADPHHAEALHGLGVLAQQQGDPASAEALLAAAVQQSPDVARYHVNLGTARFQRGDLAGARAALAQGLALDPAEAGALNGMGVVLQTAGQVEPAGAAFRNAIALAPHWADPYGNLGALARRGPAAVAALRRAVTLDDRIAAAHNNLGNALIDGGDPAAAVVHYGRAVALLPDLAPLHFNLGRALALAGRPAEAIFAYRSALKQQPAFVEALANLGPLLSAAGNGDGAVAALAGALAVRPDYAPACNNLALILLRRGEAAAAARWCRRALTLRPGFDQAHVNLGQAIYRLHSDGQGAAARAHLAAWLAAFPGHPVADHMAAALGAAPAPERCDDDYVRITFDQFAASFDDRLAELDYRAPQLLAAALAPWLPAEPLASVLDAGCGTGLSGPGLRGHARQLDGIDLSPAMIEQAARRGCYDHLQVAELTAALAAAPASRDLIVAADVLCYFGSLDGVLAAAAAALRPDGLLAFTVERLAGDGDFRLGSAGRYAHSSDYVQSVLAGWTVLAQDRAVLRREGAMPVEGLVVVARRPALV